jgi:hypothetical protein
MVNNVGRAGMQRRISKLNPVKALLQAPPLAKVNPGISDIGDTVNLAARLEAHTKEAQRMILIDDATCAGLRGRRAVTPLGSVQLKGKAATVNVFAVGA